MKLRTAIKIQRRLEEPFRKRKFDPGGKWKKETIWKSRTVCRRRVVDRRIPYIPDDDELKERFKLMIGILGECMIDDPAELEAFQNELWSD